MDNPALLRISWKTSHYLIQLRILSTSPPSQEEDVHISPPIGTGGRRSKLGGRVRTLLAQALMGNWALAEKYVQWGSGESRVLALPELLAHTLC